MTASDAAGIQRRRAVEGQLQRLAGFLQGVAIDGVLKDEECAVLKGWISDNEALLAHPPFEEVVPHLRHALEDGELTEDERADILWLCELLSPERHLLSHAHSQLEHLRGLLGGIASDGEITQEELESLQGWLEGHAHLKRFWPYDEVVSLISHVLEDGRVTEAEHELLIAVLADFVFESGGHAPPLSESEMTIDGVCAKDPVVTFEGKLFAISGTFESLTRSHVKEAIRKAGGRFTAKIGTVVDFLVVGAATNPMWPFAVSGRKVAEAVKLRKDGYGISIITEEDLVLALDAAG